MIYNEPAAVRGTPLAQLTPGSIIKLNENGSPVEFYVAKHDYEESLNGAGRTLVVRKDYYDIRQWNTTNYNMYGSSAIDRWFNGDYKSLLDPDIQSAIGTTKVKYTIGYGNHSTVTLERGIFALSVTELGRTAPYANTEGSALDIASTLQIAHKNGSAFTQWTRSPYLGSSRDAYYLNANGGVNSLYCGGTCGSRPAFTLSNALLVQKDGTIIVD